MSFSLAMRAPIISLGSFDAFPNVEVSPHLSCEELSEMLTPEFLDSQSLWMNQLLLNRILCLLHDESFIRSFEVHLLNQVRNLLFMKTSCHTQSLLIKLLISYFNKISFVEPDEWFDVLNLGLESLQSSSFFQLCFVLFQKCEFLLKEFSVVAISSPEGAAPKHDENLSNLLHFSQLFFDAISTLPSSHAVIHFLTFLVPFVEVTKSSPIWMFIESSLSSFDHSSFLSLLSLITALLPYSSQHFLSNLFLPDHLEKFFFQSKTSVELFFLLSRAIDCDFSFIVDQCWIFIFPKILDMNDETFQSFALCFLKYMQTEIKQKEIGQNQYSLLNNLEKSTFFLVFDLAEAFKDGVFKTKFYALQILILLFIQCNEDRKLLLLEIGIIDMVDSMIEAAELMDLDKFFSQVFSLSERTGNNWFLDETIQQKLAQSIEHKIGSDLAFFKAKEH